VLSTVIASSLFARVQPDYDNVWLEYSQIALYGLLSGWVVTGFVTALMGFYVSVRGDKHALSAKQVANHPMNPDARTAIVMPICNEDVATVFAGLRATCESVAATGHAGQFDVFVLSEAMRPRSPRKAHRRLGDLRGALAQPRQQPQPAQVRVYYRLRTRRTHRKAGNVADSRRWGGTTAYGRARRRQRQAAVPTRWSLMSNPSAGIIQTATQPSGHVTLHARARLAHDGRLFILGMRSRSSRRVAFTGSQRDHSRPALHGPLRGGADPRQGGVRGIMSRLRQALMRRAVTTWLVADLVGSYGGRRTC
jgi:membrane glycosyltransferase